MPDDLIWVQEAIVKYQVSRDWIEKNCQVYKKPPSPRNYISEGELKQKLQPVRKDGTK